MPSSSSVAGRDTERAQAPGTLLEAYTRALEAFMEDEEEAHLQQAYSLGRAALAAGLGVLDMASCHTQALARILADDPRCAGRLAAAGQFLLESLSPFEITHRGYTEAELERKASERRYRELFENANDIVFSVDLTGRVTSVNRAAEELSGYSRDEVRELDLTQVVAPKYLPLVGEMLARTARGELDRAKFEIEILTRDGRAVPIEVHTALLYDEGRPVGVHGIARDITERRRMEQALRQLTERREQEVRRIAHALHDEAGQLLGSVHLALMEFAQQMPPGTRERLAPVKRLLGEIEEELRRLSHELRPTILDDLGLRPALEYLAAGVGRRSGLAITVGGDIGCALPAAAAIAVYRAVQEGLTNAVRHARATAVRIQLEHAGDEFRCAVVDDGVGFDPEAVRPPDARGGLGLLGIRERVGTLGGAVHIESRPGAGTVLRIAIPVGGAPCP